MSELYISAIKDKFRLEGDDPKQYSPLSLAFIGDSIYGAIIKTIVVLRGNCSANDLDKKAVRYIKAVSQAKVADRLVNDGLLSDEELAVYKRGRNTKSATSAKNAPMADYRKATGLEALVGFLYLKGDMDRVLELIEVAIKTGDEDGK